MLRVKNFNDFFLSNSKLSTADLCKKIASLDEEISITLAKLLLIINIAGFINQTIICFVCSVIEYNIYKFKLSLEPKEN